MRCRDCSVAGSRGDPYGRRMTRTPLISLLAVALLAGCGSDNSDRAGGEKPVKAKVLAMANANDELGELEAFGEAVGRVSGGRLRIKWLNEYGRGRDGNAEINLIRDVNAGKADLGWAGTRVFDELGDPAFNPLHAPMLIDSYELEEKVLSDGLVDPMLESLGDLELQGIGVLPGPLRRPLGKHPLRGPDDWAGARISESGGDQIERALRSLGAKVLYDNPSVQRGHRHVRRDRDAHRGRARQPLPPRPAVSHGQRRPVAASAGALRRPGRQLGRPRRAARGREGRHPGGDRPVALAGERRAVGGLPCDASRSSPRPRRRSTGCAPRSARSMTSWSATPRRATPSRGSAELARDGAERRGPGALPAASKPATGATIPAGTYRTFITRADAKEHGFAWANVVEEDPDPKALKSKTKEYRLEFTEQGTFLVFDVRLDGTANIGWEGTYSIYRDRITVQGNEGTKMTARVEIDGDRLRFTDVQPGPTTPEALTWGSKPFVKID